MNKTLFTLFVLALIVAPTICVQNNRMVVQAAKNSLDKLKANKGTWASFLITLAEVHMTTGGPLDQLIAAIVGVIDDLGLKLQQAHDNFQKRTAQNQSENRRINDLIDSANNDIASTSEFLAQLGLQRDQLIQDINNLEKSIADNERATAEAIALRKFQNDEFLVKVPEHEGAIAALSEALGVLTQLEENGGAASLLQIKKIKSNVDILNKKLKKGQDKAFLNALMDLASSSQFADQSMIQNVKKIMFEVQQNLTTALAQLNADEEKQVADHAADLKNKANELNQFHAALSQTKNDLEVTNERIKDNEDFLALRQRDLAQSQKDLQDENDAYARDTKAYEDLVAQFETELSACQQALEHLQSSEIADYIGGRMSQDVIISQPHGAPIAHETNHVA